MSPGMQVSVAPAESVTPVGEPWTPTPFRWTRTNLMGAVIISAIYFADVFLKASQKCYWYDELFTVYLCRLPRFADLWRAVLHGADFNPPLLYLFTRVSQALFGHGLIATRVPSAIGVWLFGLCLFLFVARRAGTACGLIAGLFPFFTLAQYYAYEARAHGILVGWCGLALLCWQRERESERRYLWLAGFGLSLFGALLTHVYAVYLFVPFAVAELYSLCRRQRVHWAIPVAMLCASTPVIGIVYPPLFRSYRANVPATFMVPNHAALQGFLMAVYGPALIVLLGTIVLCSFEYAASAGPVRVKFTKREMLVAAAFTLLPLLGFLGARVSHGPFVDRYFLSSMSGMAIFLAGAISLRPSGTRSAQILAAFLLLFMVGDLVVTTYLVTGSHSISLVEPSSKLAVSTTPAEPMQMYETVSQDRSRKDVLVLPSLYYFYFVEYAPPSVASRLYFASASDVGLQLYKILAQWGHFPFQTTNLQSFLAGHDSFLVYAGKDGGDLDAMRAIANQQYRLVSTKGDAGGTLYEFAR